MPKAKYDQKVRELLNSHSGVRINYKLQGELESCTSTDIVTHYEFLNETITELSQWLEILNDQDIIEITKVS